MELWVRSQDKERLMKINGLNYVGYNDNHIINGYGTNECDNYDLGLYKTKERALEVLDEIQDILKPRMVLTKLGDIVAKTCDGTIYSKPNEYDIKEMSTYVYEMPKD